MFGPAQAAVARAVVDSVESGVIPRDKADDYCVMVGVFIHWDAADDKKIYDYNYQATKESIQRALAEQAERATTSSPRAKTAKHPFSAEAEGECSHGVESRTLERRTARRSTARPTPLCVASPHRSDDLHAQAPSATRQLAASPSVFDRVVAYDGGADEVMSYGGVAEADVRDLVHGASSRAARRI